jgi:hypothetical protein
MDNYTDINIISDHSGSMDSIATDMIEETESLDQTVFTNKYSAFETTFPDHIVSETSADINVTNLVSQ